MFNLGQIFVAGDGRPAAFAANAAKHVLVMRPDRFARLFIGRGNKAGGMHADRPDFAAHLGAGAVIQVDIGQEPLGVAADDGQHHLQILPHHPHHRFRAATDTDPHHHAVRPQRRLHPGAGQAAAGFAAPCDLGLTHQFGKQVQPLLEQLVIMVQIKAEQRIAFGETAAPDNRLGPAI